MPSSAHIIRANALRIPLADESVDLIVTSPPYWAQRSYRDNGEHYEGQIGSEPHPRYWLDAMFAIMKECWRVLNPGGSCFVNLGDKRAGSGGHNNSGLGPSAKSTLTGSKANRTGTTAGEVKALRRNAPDRYEQAHFGRPKSRQALPERFIIGCEDGLADPDGIGWIYRQCICWEKINGLPESCGDRTRDNFEFIYHLTKSEYYFAAMDEIREPHNDLSWLGRDHGSVRNPDRQDGGKPASTANPLGKLPGSVWRIPSEPLKLPTWRVVRAGRTVQWFTGKEDDAYALALKWMRAMGTSGGRPSLRRVASHFAAFPTELSRRIILGFSPSAICTACGEGRRPVAGKRNVIDHESPNSKGGGRRDLTEPDSNTRGMLAPGRPAMRSEVTILGYACACTPRTSHRGKRGDWRKGREANPSTRAGESETIGALVARRPGGFGTKIPLSEGEWEYHFADWTPPPTQPAVVCDPFSGTGTTIGVAKELGRLGVGFDLSHSYCAVAHWRVDESGQFAKAEQRTWQAAQGSLL